MKGYPMRFSISQNELLNALTVVQKGVSTRSTLAILSGVLLIAEGDSLTLKTTNGGDLKVKYTANALVEEPGKTVVSAKLLFDIVKNLNDAAVHVTVTNDLAQIKCDTSAFTIHTINADDFPEFPQYTPNNSITLPYTDFCQMVRRVTRATSKDQDRPILTGVLLNVENGKLTMVATDSYRLALTEYEFAVPTPQQFSVVISGSFLSEVASLPKGIGDITIGVADNQIIITYQNTMLINNRINGNFPNYKNLLTNSRTYTAQVVVPVNALTAAVRRMALVGEKNAQMKLSLYPRNQFINVAAQTSEVGSVEDSLTCAGEGEDVQIAFNCAYILDGLAAIDTEMCSLEVQAANRPGILRAGEGQSYLYLIMPVKLQG